MKKEFIHDNGELTYGCGLGWDCPNGRAHQVKSWMDRMRDIEFDLMITFTTKVPYSGPADKIKSAWDMKAAFTEAVRYELKKRKLSAKFVWAAGVGEGGNLLHFHYLVKGKFPRLRWMKNKWCELAKKFGLEVAHHIKIVSAEKGHAWYLVHKNAGLLPSKYANCFDLRDGRILSGLHRMGASSGLLPKRIRVKPRSNAKFRGFVSPLDDMPNPDRDVDTYIANDMANPPRAVNIAHDIIPADDGVKTWLNPSTGRSL